MWNPAIETVVYSRDMIFREVESTSEIEEVKRVKEPKNFEFDLSKESHDLDG